MKTAQENEDRSAAGMGQCLPTIGFEKSPEKSRDPWAERLGRMREVRTL